MYLVKISRYPIKYNYVILEVIILLEEGHQICLIKFEYFNPVSCSITISKVLRQTISHENNATKNLLISRINDIHIIKPPSINFCNPLLIANISIISINTITKDSV